jgi:hypothetical protein
MKIHFKKLNISRNTTIFNLLVPGEMKIHFKKLNISRNTTIFNLLVPGEIKNTL